MILLIFTLALSQDPDLAELVHRYLRETESQKRGALYRKIAKTKPDLARIEEIIRKGGGFSPSADAGRVIRVDTKTDHKERPFFYHLYVPEGYDPGKVYRLLICLHGTHGKGKDHIRWWLDAVKKEGDLFLLSPTTVGETWGGPRVGHSKVLTPIREVSEKYNIDPNQIWLAGCSMGGGGAFCIGGYYPDRLSGILCRINAPRTYVNKDRTSYNPKFLENFRNVPVYWVAGETDKLVPIALVRAGKDKLMRMKYDVEYVEKAGKGHEFFPEETPRMLDWIRKRKRDPYPTEVVFHTVEKHFLRAYWVEIRRYEKGPTLRIHHMSIDNKLSEKRVEYFHEIKVRARLDKKRNRIDLNTERVKELKLYLSDRMLDLDKPVHIFANGERVWSKKVSRSLRLLLKGAARRHDRGLLFTAEVKIRIR